MRQIELTEKLTHRFLVRVGDELPTGCIPWVGWIDRDGYGQMVAEDNRGKIVAHRYAYTLYVGKIDANLYVDHLCRNRACVNPDHLRLATHKQNQENLPLARKGSTTGLRGVTYHKASGKYRVRVTSNKVTISAGLYNTPEEAYEVSKKVREKHFTHSEN